MRTEANSAAARGAHCSTRVMLFSFGIQRASVMGSAFSPAGDVTGLLQQIRAGDPDAANKLVPLVLSELRTLARLQLSGERPGHTLQPTALVNEAYLRLVSDQARDWRSRAHFIGVSVSIMRRILIDYARRRQSLKRQGGEQTSLDALDPVVFSFQEADELVALDLALDRLQEINPRQRRIVELRYFGGLSVEETAEAMNVSPVTVKRDWVAARAWLKGRVRPEVAT